MTFFVGSSPNTRIKNINLRKIKSTVAIKKGTEEMKNIKKTKAKNVNQTANKKNGMTIYAAPFILLAAALLVETLIIFGSGAGAVGKFISGVLLGVCGAAAYVFPIGLLVIAFFYGEIKAAKSLKFKYITLSCLALFFAAAQSALSEPDLINITVKECYVNGGIHRGGGVLGSAVAKLFALAMGNVGAAVLSILLCVAALTFFVGNSPIGVWAYVAEAIRDSKGMKAPKTKKKPVSEEKKTEKLPEASPEVPIRTTLAFSASKRNHQTTISDVSDTVNEYDSYGGYSGDSYRGNAEVEDNETPEEKAKAAEKAKNWADLGSEFGGAEEESAQSKNSFS